jgi:hypothetical protein
MNTQAMLFKKIANLILRAGFGFAVSSYAMAVTVPAKIEAEAYNSMAGIQLENSTEGTQNVGWIDTGDWLTYTITVPTTGSYVIQYRVASPNSTGVISLDYNAGAVQLGSVNVPNTGGWQNWTTVSQTVNLAQGTYNLGVFATAGGFNINWINIVSNIAPAGSRADSAFNGFNAAFLVNSGGNTFYKKSINDGNADGTWVASLDILVAEDAYERTGNPAQKTLVDNLCKTWLKNTPMPWDWDGWNDDIGWFSIALIRGYQMTGKVEYLNAAKYGFDMAWARGWDTVYNGGGIWEQQPEKTPAGESISKEALSNDSLGKAAVMLYQSTHDRWYLDRATQIHAWVVSHIYNAANGQVYTGIDRQNVLNKGAAVYNQGTFIDFSHLLYLVTGDSKYYDYAKKSIDYVKNNMTTNGIIANNANYLNTWGDEMARGLGHFARDTRQWDTYYSWMQQNADSIWNNRRTDYNITWNGWNEKTSTDNSLATSKFDSAISWLQFTPPTKPNNIAGIHYIVSKQSGIAIDSAGLFGDGTVVVLWGINYGQNQKWLFTQNDDTSWNIISMSSWKSLDVPASNKTDGTALILWSHTHGDNQRWWVDQQPDGSYKIWNKATSGALDNSFSSTNGTKLIQWGWSGGDQQRWLLQ